jgi:outer membrane protein assembly factor BamB
MRIALVAVLAVTLLPAVTLAAGMGGDYFELSTEGKVLRDAGKKPPFGQAYDAQTGILYRLDGKKLTATGDEVKGPIWSADLDAVPRNAYTAPFLRLEGLVIVETKKSIYGFDRATGKELYRAEPPAGMQPANRNEWDDAPTSSGLYYVSQKTQRINDKYEPLGWREVAVGPVVLARLDLRTGKLAWKREVTLPDNRAISGVFGGRAVSLTWGKDYWFDPRTGLPPDRPRVLPKATRQELFAGDTVYILSGEEKATVEAYMADPAKPGWKLEKPAPNANLGFFTQPNHSMYTTSDEPAAPWTFGRLLLASSKDLTLIDIAPRDKLVVAAIPWRHPEQGSSHIIQSRGVIAVQDGHDLIRAFDPVTGKELWAYEGANLVAVFPAPPTAANAGTDIVFVVPRPMPETKRENVQLDLVALSGRDGKPLWRWNAPMQNGFADSVELSVRPMRTGWLVGREWFIGE